MYKLYCRTYQEALKIGAYFGPWRKPKLLAGQNSLRKLPKLIKSKDINCVLIVTDKGIMSLGLIDQLLEDLTKAGIKTLVYNKTVPNPTIDNIEEALELFKENECTGIIAFGGGSSMDCAKGVGARVAQPNKTISQMKGQLKVRKKTPPTFAIPTTAGTGSEATIAAVITDSKTHEKYALNDMVLIPHYAVLDPLLTVNLPPHITATTGMDALTHAVEAYIGRSNTKATKKFSEEAIKLVFENIQEAYENGENITARDNMQKASFFAGIAFTRAYVGYVHAIAHTLGGMYSVPHGLANAVILPYVLTYYGDSVYKSLGELADLLGIGDEEDTQAQKAIKFIEAIIKLNKSMGIPSKISGIMDKDIKVLVQRALKEANPLYPVPKILMKQDLYNIITMIKE
ncbi:MAG: iron-containing alcohol dehydrogenase [Cellulosilyticaceae bacterium]